jgi:DNA-binding CsgD family transcriptional regulator/tetratricopeptide (TPR) repeat protein
VITRPVLCRPFIGRREELAFLHEKRREAASAHGSFVLVAGDAGFGKSRLVSEFCASLASSRWRIAQVTCADIAGRPYGPLLDALKKIDSTPSELQPAASQREQLDAVAERIETIASRRALAVVIEDIQWADSATLNLLAHLGPRLEKLRILIVATYRPEWENADHPVSAAIAKIERSTKASRIDLKPLAGSELQAFIEATLDGVSLPEKTRRAIVRTGEGNPFFTEELLKSALERGDAEIPRTIRATLLERLRPLDEAQRSIVGQAAVIGRTFRLELLASVVSTDSSTLLSALRCARDAQLIEEIDKNAFRFRHGLTREAIYRDFLDSERLPMHRTVALALEAESRDHRSIEALAYHWWAAGDDERSVQYNRLAGDAAASIHAHEDALAFYERALEARSLSPTGRASLLAKVAEERLALSWVEEAQATYVAAAELFGSAGDSDWEARCRVDAALLAYMRAAPSPGADLEAMLSRLPAGEYVARTRAHLGLAWLAATWWRPSQALDHLRQVDSRAIDAPDVKRRFHNISAWVAMTLGDVAQFEAEFREWLRCAEDAQPATRTVVGVCVNGAMCYSFFGMHEQATAYIAKAFRVAREARNPYAEETCHAFAALCSLASGDLRKAREHVEAIPATTENHLNFTFATAWGTVVAAYLDDEQMIGKWFDGFYAAGKRTMEMECTAGFAEILARRGRHAEASAVLHQVLPDCELIRGSVLMMIAIAKYGADEDRGRARAYLARAAEAPTELPERPALALFDALDHLRRAEHDVAQALARDAAAGFGRLHMPLLEAAALECAGQADEALAIYRRCGAEYDVRRLSPNQLALSEREREVAVLAARGKSNLQIAKALSISHKTVEKHLSSIFDKLGVRSRAHLAAVVAQNIDR